MAGRLLVVDEWLLNDLLGHNGPRNQGQAFEFLQKLVARCDRIAVTGKSPWVRKAYDLSRQGSNRPELRPIARYLFGQVLINSEKAVWRDPEECAGRSSELGVGIPADDRYLVDLYLCVGADELVTTDQALAKALAEAGVAVSLRDGFLDEYLRAAGP